MAQDFRRQKARGRERGVSASTPWKKGNGIKWAVVNFDFTITAVICGFLLLLWIAADALNVFCNPLFSAGDTDWERKGVSVKGATAEQVYEFLIADFEERGYMICYNLEEVRKDNLASLCIGNCGPVTSFRKGIIIAQGYGRTSQQTAWVKWTFVEQNGGSLIALEHSTSRMVHAPLFEPLRSIPEPADDFGHRAWQELPLKIAQEIERALTSDTE